MTYLILAVIGIFLASGAALVLMVYGGEYFIDAKNDAHAMDLENAMVNVLAAYRIHEIKLGSSPSSVSQMTRGTGSGTLDAVPVFADGSLLNDSFQTLTVDGTPRLSIIVNRVPEDTCRSINMRLNRPTPTSASGSFGCFWSGSQHIAFKTI